ncbi:MAG: DCC1-like thiol-disulfide oxidoreductase family protein [Rickettsiales bacterium]|nr:DCC1-like thiol-disulfide oxidoreductase family protein [Rickettsiales bacterium]
MHTGSVTTIIYDGYCPICNYARTYYRLRTAVGELQLINMRDAAGHPAMARIQEAGLDLNEGMTLIHNDRLYYGQDALHMLALLGSSHDWFNRITTTLFRYKPLACLFYPLFKAIRRIALIASGKNNEPIIY